MKLRSLFGAVSVACLAMAAPDPARAQRQPAYQDGANLVAGDAIKYIAPGRYGVAGGLAGDSAGKGTNPFSITDGGTGLGLSINSASTGGAYSALGLGHDANGNAVISVDSYGGAPEVSCTFRVNGASYPCGQTVTGMAMAANNAALAATATSTYPNGLWRLDYAAGGAPPLFFTPLSGSCTANSLANDGGSCTDATGGNSWKSQPVGPLDWREFGAIVSSSDNAPSLQKSTAAAYTRALPLNVCGSGTFKVQAASIYYTGAKIRGCAGTIVQAFGGGAFPVLSPAETPTSGSPFPKGLGLFNVSIQHLTIDMNHQAGTGILMQATENSEIRNNHIYNNAAIGTFPWTDNQGTGTVPSAAMAMIGSNVLNVENVVVDTNQFGNGPTSGFAYTDCPSTGGYGLYMGAASQNVVIQTNAQTQYANVPNGNVIKNNVAWCNHLGFYNEWGSDNPFDNNDTTWSADVGHQTGTWGHHDLQVGYSPANGDTISLKVASSGLTGSPVTKTYTAGSGETSAVMAAGMAALINGNTPLANFGISAVVPAGSSIVRLVYSEPLSAGVNFDLSSSGSLITQSSGWTYAHSVSGNVMTKQQGEQTRLAGFSLGPNALRTTIDNPGSYAGTPKLVYHYYGGNFGTQNPKVTNWTNTQSLGTFKSASFTADCLNDQQPYLIDTTSAAVNVTMPGYSQGGITCSFRDGRSAGSWSPAKAVGIVAPGTGSAWGDFTVQGSTTLSFTGKAGHFSLTNDGYLWNGGTTALPMGVYSPTITCGTGAVAGYTTQKATWVNVGGVYIGTINVLASGAGDCSGTVSVLLPSSPTLASQAQPGMATDRTNHHALAVEMTDGAGNAATLYDGGSNPTVTHEFSVSVVIF